jgi:hypothetical protein
VGQGMGKRITPGGKPGWMVGAGPQTYAAAAPPAAAVAAAWMHPPGGDFQLLRAAVLVDDQGMVPRRLEGVVQPRQQPHPRVEHRARLAVHDAAGGPYHAAAKHLQGACADAFRQGRACAAGQQDDGEVKARTLPVDVPRACTLIPPHPHPPNNQHSTPTAPTHLPDALVAHADAKDGEAGGSQLLDDFQRDAAVLRAACFRERV